MNFWRIFFSRWQNWIGTSLAVAFLLVAIAAPLISAPDPKSPGPFKVVGRFTDPLPHPPGEIPGVILGTMPGQFDVFHTLVWGFRDAMRFGLFVALGAFTFGVLFGAISGYAGGATNSLMMRAADAFLAFPPLAGAVFLKQLAAAAIVSQGGVYYFNPQLNNTVLFFEGQMPFMARLVDKVDPLLISLILFSWMPYARIVNTIVIGLKESGFILSARALGGGAFWVIRRHLLPNSVSPALVLAARDVGSAVILQATMVVIGLGGTSSPWGILLATGRNWITSGVLRFWWVYLPVTIAMVLFGITWNLIGDGLSEALSPDPAMHKTRKLRPLSQTAAVVQAPARAPAFAGLSRQEKSVRLFGMTPDKAALFYGFLIVECLVAAGLVLIFLLNP